MHRWRVPLGFVCGGLFFGFGRPRPLTLIVGAAVAVPGLALRAWATGHLKKNAVLANPGPYAYPRNPLYLGSFLIGVGFTIATGRWFLGIAFAALFLGIYVPVMRVESTTLAALFGESYQRYAQAVPLFLPRFRRYEQAGGGETRFEPALYRRYREYRAAIGLVVAWALLALGASVK